MTRTGSLVHALVLSLLCILNAGLVSCERKPKEPAPDAVYVVRGVVVMLPDPKDPTSEFRLHHEEIPDFKNSEGKVVGMREMEMPFPVNDPKLVEGLSLGDKVEVTFADWYKPIRTYKVTKVVKLPPDTKLNLRDE